MAGSGSIKINVSPKFAKSGGPIQLQDIANQLARLVYNKDLTSCLGEAQNVHIRNIKGKHVRVNIPAKIRGTDLKSVKLLGYINNMISHCRKHDVSIQITG